MLKLRNVCEEYFSHMIIQTWTMNEDNIKTKHAIYMYIIYFLLFSLIINNDSRMDPLTLVATSLCQDEQLIRKNECGKYVDGPDAIKIQCKSFLARCCAS